MATNWFYAIHQQRIGPIDEEQLRELAKNGSVQATTLVWCAGMTNWQAIATTPQFAGLFESLPPHIPQQPGVVASIPPVGHAPVMSPHSQPTTVVSPDDGAMSTLIPYRNGQALAAYYTGVFSLIPGIGALLAIVAIILGIMGWKFAVANPTAKGKGHAVTGIVLGSLVLLAHLALVIIIAIGAAR